MPDATPQRLDHVPAPGRGKRRQRLQTRLAAGDAACLQPRHTTTGTRPRPGSAARAGRFDTVGHSRLGRRSKGQGSHSSGAFLSTARLAFGRTDKLAAIMIRLQNLTLQRGPQRLLEGAELTLHPGQKAGRSVPTVPANPHSSPCCVASWCPMVATASCRRTGASRTCAEIETLERPAVDYVLDGDVELRASRPNWLPPSRPMMATPWRACTPNWTTPTATAPMRGRASCSPGWAFQ